MTTNIRFEDWLAEQMQDPELRQAMEELEPAYQVTRLRIARGLTQEQLAELVGTKQSSIARLESGKSEPRLSFLRRVVEALGGKLEVKITSQEETLEVEQPSSKLLTKRDNLVIGSIPVNGTSFVEVPQKYITSQTINVGTH